MLEEVVVVDVVVVEVVVEVVVVDSGQYGSRVADASNITASQ